jgi:hypothetical protein
MGQFIQILNNLGGAKIPTDNETYAYYSVLPSIGTYSLEYITFSGKKGLYASSPKASEIIAAMKTATNNTEVIKAGRYATATLIKYNSADETGLMDMTSGYTSNTANSGDSNNQVDMTADNNAKKAEAWGITSGTSNNSNARNRVAVIATKSTQIVAPTSTDSE